MEQLREFFDAKSFNPAAFMYKVAQTKKPVRNELLHSGAIKENNEIKAALSNQSAGNYLVQAVYGELEGEPTNYDGETDIEAGTTKTYQRGVVVIGRARAWKEKDFTTDITQGEEPIDMVARKVGAYWDEVDQKTLLAILEGVFSMTRKANDEFIEKNTYDITEDEENNTFGATTLNNALQQAAGDNKESFHMVIMHSAVATNLENLNLMEYMKYTDDDGIERKLPLGFLNGRTVLVDDSMPVEEVNTGTEEEPVIEYKYTSYALGEGAIDYADIGAEVPFEMDRDAKKNGGETLLYTRQRKVFAPRGISFNKPNMASKSPTTKELKDGKNWDLATDEKGNPIDHQVIPIARIITKG